MTRPITSIQQDLMKLADRQAELERELAEAEAIPPEPEPGSIIKFHVQFLGSDPVYRMTAIRVDPEAWVLVSPEGHAPRHTWDSLIDVMKKDVAVRQGIKKLTYQRVKDWETVTW